MQRTRCAYFRDDDAPPCNKRRPGSGCSARHGLNRNHAIFGWSDACVATNPSDVAVAFAALDAIVHVRGLAGDRSISFVDFHRLPDSTPERDNVLGRGDLVVAVEVPARVEGCASHYLKVRDRESYEFALVSVAAAVAVDGKHIRSARLAVGGVAHKPWRLAAAESALRGVPLDEAVTLSAAIAQSFADAGPLAHNGFKVELAKRAALRALQNRRSTQVNTIGEPDFAGRWAAEGDWPGLPIRRTSRSRDAAHDAIVYSTIANGRTVSIDTIAAEKAPGALAVFTHRNLPRMNPTPKPWSHLHPHGQGYLPLQDDKIH